MLSVTGKHRGAGHRPSFHQRTLSVYLIDV